ncbi:MAG: glycosyltransferase family 9 protein, partial [Terriglobus sp.]
ALQGLPIAAMWPAIAEAHSRNDWPWIRAAYRRMRMLTLGILAVACGIMLPFGKSIIRLWAGPSAVPSTHLLVLMCVWMCLSAITVYQSNLMGAVSRVSRQAISSALAAVVNLALSLFWVRSMGQVGVLLATVTSYVVFVVAVQLYEVRQILRGTTAEAYRDEPGMKKRCIQFVRKMLRSLEPLARHLPIGKSRLSAEKADRLQRILLLHPGHIGDLVIATAMLKPLRQRFPGVRFGFAVNSGSAVVLQGLADVQTVHVIDHWRLNRGNLSLIAKWKHYATTRAKAIASIREERYDCAICLLNEDPDLLDIAWRADVPMRVGFSHSYFAPLATHTVLDSDENTNQMVRQSQLLRAFGIVPEELALHAELAQDTSDVVTQIQTMVGDRPYRIIHMGAGYDLKEMPEGFWRTIAEQLAPTCTLVFTGRGERERAMAERVAADLPGIVMACNRLSWPEFVAIVRNAEILYGVDSMAGHVAAAVDTQSVLAYSGLNSIVRWRPYSTLATVFTVPEPCAPCHLPHGCPPMPCKNIPPTDMLAVQILTA